MSNIFGLTLDATGVLAGIYLAVEAFGGGSTLIGVIGLGLALAILTDALVSIGGVFTTGRAVQ